MASKISPRIKSGPQTIERQSNFALLAEHTHKPNASTCETVFEKIFS